MPREPTSKSPAKRSPVPAAPPAEDDEEPAEIDEFLEELPLAPAVQRRRKKLVLIGAGYAHLQILEWWRDEPLPGVELTLISPFPQAVYGGMLPAVLAGLLPEAEMKIDLTQLTRRCRAELLVDKVVGLDPETRTVDLAVHPEQTFDVASIDLEPANVREDLCQTHRLLVAVNPLATFLSRLEVRVQELLTQYRDAPGPDYLQLAVIGGGAMGIELALCLEERAHREGWHAEVRVIESQIDILAGYAPRTVRLVHKLFRKRAISLHVGSAVVDCDEDGPAELVLESGERIRIDLAIWAAGVAPPRLLQGYRLPKSPDGYLAVQPTLQTTAEVPVFAAGNLADIVEHPSPKADVHAIEQGAVLWDNLQGWFQREELSDYDPPEWFRSFLCCGDGTAILNYRGWGLRSRWMWRWKRRLDQHFIERFR